MKYILAVRYMSLKLSITSAGRVKPCSEQSDGIIILVETIVMIEVGII